jgi:hypothetical protein
MDRDELSALVARIVVIAEQRGGGDADPWGIYREAEEAVWDWWSETPGLTTQVAHLVLREIRHEIRRRAANRQPAAAGA